MKHEEILNWRVMDGWLAAGFPLRPERKWGEEKMLQERNDTNENENDYMNKQQEKSREQKKNKTRRYRKKNREN